MMVVSVSTAVAVSVKPALDSPTAVATKSTVSAVSTDADWAW